MKPSFEIYADGERVTPIFLERGVSISVVDEAGVSTDSLTITVQDRERDLAIPRRGAQLLVRLGYEGEVEDMGLFVVDECECHGPPDSIVIKATGAPLIKAAAYKALQTRKTRSWEPTTVAVLAYTIAVENGLTPEISPTAATIELPHIDQTDESDMNLLTRIAKDRDLIVKPQQGHLIVLPRSESKNTNGRALPILVIEREGAGVSRYSFRVSNRNRYQAVVTKWHDKTTGQEVEESAGTGEPVFRAPHQYPNQQTAIAARDAYFRNFRRKGTEATVTSAGRVDAYAEGRALLVGFRPEFDDGLWKVMRVQHDISVQGFNTTISLVAQEEILPQAKGGGAPAEEASE